MSVTSGVYLGSGEKNTHRWSPTLRGIIVKYDVMYRFVQCFNSFKYSRVPNPILDASPNLREGGSLYTEVGGNLRKGWLGHFMQG